MSQRKQGSDRSGREGYREPDAGTAIAEMSESWDLDVRKYRGARISFSSEHRLMAMLEVTGRSKQR